MSALPRQHHERHAREIAPDDSEGLPAFAPVLHRLVAGIDDEICATGPVEEPSNSPEYVDGQLPMRIASPKFVVSVTGSSKRMLL